MTTRITFTRFKDKMFFNEYQIDEFVEVTDFQAMVQLCAKYEAYTKRVSITEKWLEVLYEVMGISIFATLVSLVLLAVFQNDMPDVTLTLLLACSMTHRLIVLIIAVNTAITVFVDLYVSKHPKLLEMLPKGRYEQSDYLKEIAGQPGEFYLYFLSRRTMFAMGALSLIILLLG